MRKLINKVITGLIESTPEFLISRFFSSVTPIFMLHRLDHEDPQETSETLAHLKWCLSYIRKQGYQPVSLSQLINQYLSGEVPQVKSVVFTIDDGFYDHYEIGGKIFSEFDVPLCCFVITDFLDGKLWPWDDQVNYILRHTSKDKLSISLPDGSILALDFTQNGNSSRYTSLVQNRLKTIDQTHLYTWLESFYQQAEVLPPEQPEYYRPMSWNDAQKFIDLGHEIAAHTQSHRILSQLSDEESQLEIEGSFNRVHSKLKTASMNFAYPTGRLSDYGEREIKTLQNLGIKGAVDTIPQHTSVSSFHFQLPRFALPETRFDFIQYLSFFEELKRRIK